MFDVIPQKWSPTHGALEEAFSEEMGGPGYGAGSLKGQGFLRA